MMPAVTIMEAVTNNDLYSLNDLLHKGLDPTIDHNEPLCTAARLGFADIVERLLFDVRVDPAARDHAAIFWATLFNHTEVVERLLRHPRVLKTIRLKGLPPATFSQACNEVLHSPFTSRHFIMSHKVYG